MKTILAIVVSVLLISALNLKHERKERITSDLGVSYTFAKMLQEFKSPYSNIPEDMRVNEKYPPYFPLSYITIATVDKLFGFGSYQEFYDAWLRIMKIVNFFTAALLTYLLSFRIRKEIPDQWFRILISAALSICFVFQPLVFKKSFQQFDAIAFALLLISLFFLRANYSVTSAIFLALSICFKQSFLFILPSLLILFYRNLGFTGFLRYSLAFGLVCMVVFAPFLVDSVFATIDSTIIFHFKREALRTYVDYSVPFVKLLAPELKPQLLAWGLTLFVALRVNPRPCLLVALPVTVFFMFHTYFLEQYYVVVLYCWVVGFLLDDFARYGKNADS